MVKTRESVVTTMASPRTLALPYQNSRPMPSTRRSPERAAVLVQARAAPWRGPMRRHTLHRPAKLQNGQSACAE